MVTELAVTLIELPSGEICPPRSSSPAFQLDITGAPIDTPVLAVVPEPAVTVRSVALISIVAAEPPLPARDSTFPKALRLEPAAISRMPESAGSTGVGRLGGGLLKKADA